MARFTSDAESLKGNLARRAGMASSFASGVEFSKGYRHFASVITLAKCGIAVKIAHGARSPGSGRPGEHAFSLRKRGRCAQRLSTTGRPAAASASTTGPSEPCCGIGAGNHALGHVSYERRCATGSSWGRKPRIGAGQPALGQANSLPQCTVSCPNARRHPSGQILWCGEAAPRREDAIRALRSDPLVWGSGRVVPSGTVIRRARARCPAGAGRRDPIRRGRPDRGSWAPAWRSAGTPADVRAHALHHTRPAPSD